MESFILAIRSLDDNPFLKPTPTLNFENRALVCRCLDDPFVLQWLDDNDFGCFELEMTGRMNNLNTVIRNSDSHLPVSYSYSYTFIFCPLDCIALHYCIEAESSFLSFTFTSSIFTRDLNNYVIIWILLLDFNSRNRILGVWKLNIEYSIIVGHEL